MLQGNFLLPKQNRAGGGLTNVSPCKVSVICNVVAFKQYGGLRRFFFAKFYFCREKIACAVRPFFLNGYMVTLKELNFRIAHVPTGEFHGIVH